MELKMILKRPILVGGLGLSASLGLLNIVGHSPVGHAFADGSGLLGLLAVGSGVLVVKATGAACGCNRAAFGPRPGG